MILLKKILIFLSLIPKLLFKSWIENEVLPEIYLWFPEAYITFIYSNDI